MFGVFIGELTGNEGWNFKSWGTALPQHLKPRGHQSSPHRAFLLHPVSRGADIQASAALISAFFCFDSCSSW